LRRCRTTSPSAGTTRAGRLSICSSGPNQIESIAGPFERLESGDLKLRVRALEAERALGRVQAWQQVVTSALVASTLVNVGTVLSVSAMATGATISFGGAGVFGLLLLSSYLKVVKLEKKEAQLAGGGVGGGFPCACRQLLLS